MHKPTCSVSNQSWSTAVALQILCMIFEIGDFQNSEVPGLSRLDGSETCSDSRCSVEQRCGGNVNETATISHALPPEKSKLPLGYCLMLRGQIMLGDFRTSGLPYARVAIDIL